ncbi:MAG: hypothetical protein ACYC3G_02105 [Minisyncoccota bacterium]
MLKRTTVYLVSKTENVNINILGIIRDNHGENTVIKKVNSPAVLNTPYGFSNLLQRRNKTNGTNTSRVYVIKKDLGNFAFGSAVKTRIPFGILFKTKNGRWDSTLLKGTVDKNA